MGERKCMRENEKSTGEKGRESAHQKECSPKKRKLV